MPKTRSKNHTRSNTNTRSKLKTNTSSISRSISRSKPKPALTPSIKKKLDIFMQNLFESHLKPNNVYILSHLPYVTYYIISTLGSFAIPNESFLNKQ